MARFDRPILRLALVVCTAAILFPSGTATSAVERPESDTLPQRFLWAWQRAEDLSKIDPAVYGVAYLACHVQLVDDSAVATWRDQPLKVPRNTHLIPVLRIDSDSRRPPKLSDSQIDAISKVLTKMAVRPQTCGIQIDFDAVQSEREFYKKLLHKVRACLPDKLPLSITALASWCLYDNWINDLPVEETVPMMFSLGAERAKILLYFKSANDFLVTGCCHSLGVSLEDNEVNKLMIPLARKRKIPVRVYVFTKSAWNEQKLRAVDSLLNN